jgi:hypothetical protein
MGLLDRTFFLLVTFRVHLLTRCSAVLPGGTFPGTVIRGFKGDRFKINVIDQLKDATMLRSTSIVRHKLHRSRGPHLASTALARDLPTKKIKLGRWCVVCHAMSYRGERLVFV